MFSTTQPSNYRAGISYRRQCCYETEFLFIEWFLKTFIDFLPNVHCFISLNIFTQRHLLFLCNLCVYSFVACMCVCHMLLKDLLTYLLT